MLTIGRPVNIAPSLFMLLLIVAIPCPQRAFVGVGLVGESSGSSPADTLTDLSGLKVAVYVGTSLSGPVASKDALVHMYEWMNATVNVVNDTEIQNGILDANGYEILAVPGAHPTTMSSHLGRNLRERRR